MHQNSLNRTQIFSASPTQSSIKIHFSQGKTHRNQRFVDISHLCDELLFLHAETLSDFEISILAKVAGQHRGNASPKELAIISKCAGRVGLQMGGQINA